MSRQVFLGFALALSLFAAAAHGQGVQTGSLRGSVMSSDGVALPAAAVEVTSSALQGKRTASSDVNGVYVLANLPPGPYTITISKPGLATVTRNAAVPLGVTVTQDVTLAVASVVESVVVEGTAPSPVKEIQTSANVRADEINLLPMGRTP